MTTTYIEYSPKSCALHMPVDGMASLGTGFILYTDPYGFQSNKNFILVKNEKVVSAFNIYPNESLQHLVSGDLPFELYSQYVEFTNVNI